MYRVGILGVGFVGNATRARLCEYRNCELKLNDPDKGHYDTLADCDIGFCCIHLPTEEDGTQNLELFDCIPNNFSKNTIVYIKTNILPGTSEYLSKKYGMKIHFMPEFLRERFAIEDHFKQPIVCTAYPEIISEIFKVRIEDLIQVSDIEAEWAKYTHNCLAVNIIAFMNGIYQEILKRNHKASINEINKAMSASGFIKTIYQTVPGWDGKLGWGGKCLPKDIKALIEFVQVPEFKQLLSSVDKINAFRN